MVYFPHSTNIKFPILQYLQSLLWKKDLQKQIESFVRYLLSLSLYCSGSFFSRESCDQQNFTRPTCPLLSSLFGCCLDTQLQCPWQRKYNLIQAGTQCCSMSKKGEGWSGAVLVYLLIVRVHLTITPTCSLAAQRTGTSSVGNHDIEQITTKPRGQSLYHLQSECPAFLTGSLCHSVNLLVLCPVFNHFINVNAFKLYIRMTGSHVITLFIYTFMNFYAFHL